MMVSFDEITGKSQTEDNRNLPHIPNPQYKILIIGGPRAEKFNPLLNLISYYPDIRKIFFVHPRSMTIKISAFN